MASEAAALGTSEPAAAGRNSPRQSARPLSYIRNRAAAPLLKMPSGVKTDLAATRADLAAVRVEIRWLFAFNAALLLLANARAYGLL